MEDDSTAITCFTILKKKAPDHHSNGLPLPKKKRGAFQVLKAALYLLRRKSSTKSKSMHIDVASKDSWKAFLGSMRPMHLNNNVHHSPPRPFLDKPIGPSPEELFTPPLSPFQDTASSSSSSQRDMSRYASAPNLQEFQTSEESSGEESDHDHQCARYDKDDGDEMIDAKAEEFINQFYQQIRLQNLDYLKGDRNADEDHHHKK